MKILGTVIKSNLSWNDNCQLIIKKVNARMQLLRSILSFEANVYEMVHLLIVFWRSVLEQSCVVWHSSLTQENVEDLERCQKIFTKLILKEKYLNYEDALTKLNLDDLHSRRQHLCEKFAKSCIKHKKLDDNKSWKWKQETMTNIVYNLQTLSVWKKSSIVSMQRCLNEEEKQRKRNCG